MSNFKKGDKVRVICEQETLSKTCVNTSVKPQGIYGVEYEGDEDSYLKLTQEEIEAGGGNGSWVANKDLELIPEKPKVQPKTTRNHYSHKTKRSIVRAYLELPRVGKSERVSAGSIPKLFKEHGILLNSTDHGRRLLTVKGGWLDQYENGGWDIANAVAFNRKGITGIKGDF